MRQGIRIPENGYSETSIQFMDKVMEISGLGDKTFLPDGDYLTYFMFWFCYWRDRVAWRFATRLHAGRRIHAGWLCYSWQLCCSAVCSCVMQVICAHGRAGQREMEQIS